ncbi:MAG TPA: uroporphyrinogen-III synthase [Caulobacteraceae bacterium]|nr:uroporphyrinogen-III synthase [Caulobacteraceae bacterium]
MKIWITRAEPGAAAVAERLRAAGCRPVVRPLLAARATAARFEPDGVGALAFTSGLGVHFFLEAIGGSGSEVAYHPWRAMPVFAVGDATARAAAVAGFTDVVSASGDVAALASVVGAAADRIEGIVLHPSAAEPAGDLAGALGAAGLEARNVAVYETSEVEISGTELAEGLACEAVLLHSPRASRRFAELVEAGGARALTALCLSDAVAAPLAGVALAAVLVAPEPNEPSLIALIQTLRVEAPDHPAAPDPPAAPDEPGLDRVRLLTPLFWSMMLLSAAGMVAATLVATALVVRPPPGAAASAAASPAARR